MSTGFTTTSPNTSYSYAIQSGDGGVDGADSWNPDEFTPGDQHYGSISGRDIYSQFGRGVDTDFEGERLVGGGPNWSSGRGYIQVYDWSKALGSWASIAQIDGPVAGGWFGESVSMDYDGVTIVVGAPKVNAVYICTPSISTGFAITQTINTSYASFGHCVSIAGDRADRFVVGAPAVNTIYVYEQNSVGNFAQVYSNVGTDIINDVPVNNGGSQRITLYSKFNGYGYSVKMSGFGYHIVVGSPGTELVEIQSSTQGGTTTPGALSHHLGDHMLSSTGPHYTGSTSYACNNQAAGNAGCVSASHPYSVYQVGTYTPARGTNGLRYADAGSQLHHFDRSPYGTNANLLADGYIFPNFQVGNIRILHCPDKGSWSSSVAAIGPVIKGRNVDTYNYMSNWSCIYRSLPGFGKSVSISVDGKRVTAGSPGYRAPGYDLQAAHGDTRYFVYNEIDDVYDEPMISRNATNTPSLGGPWSLIRTNQTWTSWNLAMSEDGSRVFVGSRESSYSIVPYDFSGTTFYPVGPIVRSGGSGSGPGATTFGTVNPVPEIIDGFGYLSGYRNAAHNGASCVVTHPAYPQGFGRQAGSGSNTTPATSNGQGTGIILIYRFTLTSVFRGNSLFEGYVKCDNLTVGSSGGSVDHARIKFGGRKGENTTEAATTIESRWLGTHDGVYTGENSVSAYKHDNELLISKFYSSLHLHNDTIKDGDDWNKRDFFGDRIRLKAPKIEFQLQTPQSDQQNNKYRESPCVSITEMNNPFGGERGMSYTSNSIADEPRQLVSIRTGTSNSRVQAGLRLIAGSLAGYTNAGDSLVSSIPPDGDMYTFAPGNDGWLRLLCPVGQGQSVFYQTETNPQNTSKTITSNYAGLAVGDLYVGGTISGPGASSGGGGGTSFTEVNVNSPNTQSGAWSVHNNSSSWGVPKFNVTHDVYAYNDAPGYREYNIPSGQKSAYLSQLTWSSGGYADIHGVRSDGALVFLRRINTLQAVETTSHSGQHDGSTITFIGTALDSFTSIRITNKLGRIHLTGLAFTTGYNVGTEGVGMIHSAQISDLSSVSGSPWSTVGSSVYYTSGNVGIGTTTPYAKLHVNGTSGILASGSRTYFSRFQSGLITDTGTWAALCIYANGPIVTSAYFVSHGGSSSASDERIKKDIVDIDDGSALETLRLLKPKQYKYKDDIVRGSEPVWGFIAQEVRDTLPYATELRRDVLPNIYELANVSQSNVITFTNFNTSNLESNVTTLIRTKGIDGQDHDIHLVEVIDEHTIRVEEDLSDWTGSVDAEGNVITQTETTTLTPEEYEALKDTSEYVANISGYQNANVPISVEEYNALEDTTGYEAIIENYTKTITIYPGTQLFVYGQEVNDFIFVKKEAIWTVATAALQEVDRQLQAEKTKTYELQQKVEILEMSHGALIQRIEALEKL